MDEAVAPELHNNVPVAVVDKVDVPLQLFTTFMVGAVTVAKVVVDSAAPAGLITLITPSTVLAGVVTVKVVLV
jgi:hypothetical protein